MQSSNDQGAVSDQPVMKQYYCKKYQTDDFIEIKEENISEIKGLNDKLDSQINQKLAERGLLGGQEAMDAIRPSINEKREEIKNRIQQKEKFFQFLGDAGINVNQLKLSRSNSVGGESALDYQKFYNLMNQAMVPGKNQAIESQAGKLNLDDLLQVNFNDEN